MSRGRGKAKQASPVVFHSLFSRCGDAELFALPQRAVLGQSRVLPLQLRVVWVVREVPSQRQAILPANANATDTQRSPSRESA